MGRGREAVRDSSLLLWVRARLRPSPRSHWSLQPPTAPPGYLGAAPTVGSGAAAEGLQQRLLGVSLPLQIPVLRFGSSGAAASHPRGATPSLHPP